MRIRRIEPGHCVEQVREVSNVASERPGRVEAIGTRKNARQAHEAEGRTNARDPAPTCRDTDGTSRVCPCPAEADTGRKRRPGAAGRSARRMLNLPGIMGIAKLRVRA